MKCRILAATIAVAVVVPASALAQTPTREHTRQYTTFYYRVVHEFGHRAPGRNIIRWGFAPHQPATDAQVVTSMGVLMRMLNPPPPPAPVVQTQTQYQAQAVAPSSSTPVVTGGSSGGLPSCTWVPESGGNWRAVNPSSGAGGRYQILPSTWAAYGGTGAPQDASPAQQTAIATKIYAGGAGASQWVNC